MNAYIQHNPAVFPLFFAAMWMIITTILSLSSGWFTLMAEFPDRPNGLEPLLTLRWRSATMNAVAIGNMLTLKVFPTGIQVGMLRLFGPFCRDFFVPWENITVSRKTTLLGNSAILQFGSPKIGSLVISAIDADRMAQAAGPHWPEAGPFFIEGSSSRLRRALGQWALLTAGAALFYTVAPMLIAPDAPRPPLALSILFPAIFFGVVFTVTFFVQSR